MRLRNSLGRLATLAGLIGIFSASLSGCGGGGGGVNNPPPGGGRAVCQQNPSQAGRARWTVLVYMNAANNLDVFSFLNAAQMAQVGSDNNLNIVVQWKLANCAGCSAVLPWRGTRRYRIRPHTAQEVARIEQGDTAPLDADRLPDPSTNVGGASDMGSRQTLRSFVQWGVQNYPSDQLAVVVWNHGSGWIPTRSPQNRMKPTFRAVSQDDAAGTEIDTQELPQALAGFNIDALIFDASLMQMLEVAYEVRNTAKVMVGSEESPPGQGYDYAGWLGALKANIAGKNPCEVGNDIVQTFVANYPNYTNITQSVLDLTKMDALATALNAFSNSLRQHINNEATVIRNARNNAQQYNYPENKDLYHFAELIRATATTADLRNTAANLQAAMTGQNGAIIVSARGQLNQANSNGLAIYIPHPLDYVGSYGDLALSRVTVWDQFLQEQRQ